MGRIDALSRRYFLIKRHTTRHSIVRSDILGDKPKNLLNFSQHKLEFLPLSLSLSLFLSLSLSLSPSRCKSVLKLKQPLARAGAHNKSSRKRANYKDPERATTIAEERGGKGYIYTRIEEGEGKRERERERERDRGRLAGWLVALFQAFDSVFFFVYRG